MDNPGALVPSSPRQTRRALLFQQEGEWRCGALTRIIHGGKQIRRKPGCRSFRFYSSLINIPPMCKVETSI